MLLMLLFFFLEYYNFSISKELQMYIDDLVIGGLTPHSMIFA